jgi:hypothetical protein
VKWLSKEKFKMSKIEQFWVNATAFEVARVMAGETVEARFRDEETEPWTSVRALRGWSDGKWVSVLCWTQCQVYREPSWWTERPDPGPEHRLLGKFPDESKLGTDDYWSVLGEEWRPVGSGDNDQHEETWYRRRIEQPKPEPKHYVLRVGDSVETPSGHLIKVVSPGVEQIEFKLKAGFTATLPNGQTITATEKGFEVTQ